MPDNSRSRRLAITAAVLLTLGSTLAQLLSVADPRNLKPGEFLRSVNSTPLGAVLTDRKLRTHRERAGLRVADDSGRKLDLIRYAAWLAWEHHHRPKPPAAPPIHLGVSQERAIDARDRNAARMRDSRAKTRVIEIPRCVDPKLRARLEKDVFKWLAYMEPKLYARKQTDQITTIIKGLLKAFSDGDDQAYAASRGEGKTTASEWVEIFMACQGKSPCAILFEATTELAAASLGAIKERFESNDRLASLYPEICIPVRSLNYTAQLARTQLVSGYRHDNGERYESVPTHFQWSGNLVVLPYVPGAPSAGSIIAARGLEKPVRGIKYGGKGIRPTVAIINDPDTPETVNNPEEQGKKLEDNIEKGIGGMGGQDQEVARVMLTTVQRKGTVSDRFTDPKIKPSWKGKRFRFLVKPSDRPDLWEDYVQLRELDWMNEAEDKVSRQALDHYIKHRREMDLGAIVANPNRRPGGQLSGLQYYFDFVARKGPEAAATELDNDPPEEAGVVESGITALRIQRQVNGLGRGILPPGCALVTMGIDCRTKMLHWVVRAWLANGTPFTIDYGEHLTRGTVQGTDQGLDLAVRRAIRELVEAKRLLPYRDASGNALPIKLTLVDSGWRTTAVYDACHELGLGVMPAKGVGKSNDCAVKANFNDLQKQTADRTPGDGWFITRAGVHQLSLVSMDTDRWKAWEHDRWMTEPGQVGAMTIFGQPSEDVSWLSTDQKSHWLYASHIVAEVEAEEVIKGLLVRKWKVKKKENHLLDASYMSDVAASICGVRLLPAIAAGQQRLVPASTLPVAEETYSRSGGGIAMSRPQRSW